MRTDPIIAGIMPITNASQIERFMVSCGATIPFDLAEELDRRRGDLAAGSARLEPLVGDRAVELAEQPGLRVAATIASNVAWP